jgi:phosphatidylserine/phosphatidylglycerophosphate/cardiolipin synthase-like enzyme
MIACRTGKETMENKERQIIKQATRTGVIMHWAVPALFVVWCVAACGAVQIVEFCPDPYLHDDADEYLVLSGTGSLDGFAVSDGKEGFRFPPGTTINGTLTIARDAAAFETTHGRLPDYEWYDASPRVPDVISGNKLRMANARDRLMLYDNSVLVQAVSWPEDVRPREGQVHFLEAGKWDVRPLFLGQSRFSPATYENVTLTAFVSPDSSYEQFFFALASADRTVRLNVYEFTSTALSQPLVDAHGRGADVQVLLEGGPVGGISPEQDALIRTLNQSGIPVYIMTTAGDKKAPYRFDHAKYMVVDGRAVLVTSENFGKSGFPAPGMKGNRGWGAYIESTEVARYFEDVFLSDISTTSPVPVNGARGTPEVPSSSPYAIEFPAQRFSGATVTPVLAPDTGYLVDDLLASAQVTIDIEQAYITNESATTLNPYLGAAINASRRGVHVRVLLDSYWYNIEEEADNDEMAALINRIAAAEGLPLEAKTADIESNNLEKIHNKGVIVDDKSVLVSSINWNTNSPNFNREAGVIIGHPGVARYFKDVFEDDWQPVRDGTSQRTDYLKIALLIAVLAFLVALFWWKQRRR